MKFLHKRKFGQSGFQDLIRDGTGQGRCQGRDESHQNLNRGNKLFRVLSETFDCQGFRTAGLGHLMDARHPDGNDGKFGSRQESIDHDQDDDGEQIDPNGYHSERKRPFEIWNDLPFDAAECFHYPPRPES